MQEVRFSIKFKLIGYFSKMSYYWEIFKGILKARCGPTEEESEELEFIVDSASEVVTARLETIQQLNLAYKHNILSHGIHAVEERHLYAGVLRLGSREITVEVSDYGFIKIILSNKPKFLHLFGYNSLKLFFHPLPIQSLREH